MWKILERGGGALERNEHCQYDSNSIPVTNCSSHGTCTPGGICICGAGFSGKTDWINLDTLDCQVELKYISSEGRGGLIVVVWVFICGFRLLRKTWRNSKDVNKTISQQLQKAPNRIAIAYMVCNLPLSIFFGMKWIYPETILLDPAENPAFFTTTFLCLNAEWWAYCIFTKNLIEPIIKGIHEAKHKRKLDFAGRINEILARIVPLMDLVLRIVLVIIPGIVTASMNMSHLTVLVFFQSHVYAHMKFAIYFPIFLWSIRCAISTINIENRTGSKSGSTNAKLKEFVFRVSIWLRALAIIMVLYDGICLYYFFVPRVSFTMYHHFPSYFMKNRYWTAVGQGLGLEFLYLDILPCVFNKLCFCKEKFGFDNVNGSFCLTPQATKPDQEEGAFDSENPMRNSTRDNVANPAL